MFSCKRWGRSKRHVLKFLIQALWNVALLKLVKGDFQQENNIAYISRIENWKKFCLLFQSVITYCKIPLGFPNSLFVIKPKLLSNAENIINFRIIWNYCFISCVIIDFHFVFRARFSFLIVLEKPSWSDSISVSIPIIFIPMRLSIIQFFTCQHKCSFLSRVN